jgi:hypothetical protein
MSWRASWSAWAGALDEVDRGAQDTGLRVIERIAKQDARNLARAKAAWLKTKRQNEREQRDGRAAVRHDEESGEEDMDERSEHLDIRNAMDKIRREIEDGFKGAKFRADEWLSEVKRHVGAVATLLQAARRQRATGQGGDGPPAEPPRTRRRLNKKTPKEDAPADVTRVASSGMAGSGAGGAHGGVIIKADGGATASRNRRRGSGITKKNGTVKLFYGNVTTMSRKAEEYLTQLEVDAWMAGETHLKDQDLTACLGRMEKKGWNLTAAPAVQSTQSASGTWGGALCATRTDVAAQRLTTDTPITCRSAVTEAPDLAMRILNVMGGTSYSLAGMPGEEKATSRSVRWSKPPERGGSHLSGWPTSMRARRNLDSNNG